MSASDPKRSFDSRSCQRSSYECASARRGAEAYRKLAKEMRVLAEAAQDLSNRAKLLMAADNYERTAASFDVIERSKAKIRMR